MSNIAIIILAAGSGTRMHSSLPKVLHPLAGMPLLEHVLITAQNISATITVVASEELKDHAQFAELQQKYSFSVAIQQQRLGTAHAVMAALPHVAAEHVLVLYSDVPLIEPSTLLNLLNIHQKQQAALSCLGFEAACPDGYGRLITEHEHKLIEIIEDKDLSAKQKNITICNSGILLLAKAALPFLSKIDNQNQAGEYYLTSLISILNRANLQCIFQTTCEEQVKGVNNKKQLAELEQLMQYKLRNQAMLKGVTFHAPETVFLSADTVFGKDVVLHPHVHIGKKVKLEDKVEVKPFSVIEGSHIGYGSIIGPFAHLRAQNNIADNVKIGNFVEIKNSTIKQHSKINHLSYVGDAEVGQACNIGAGTVFCNYDGTKKHQIKIGDNVFVGSNSSLIAPLAVADGAMIAAGSTIVENIESGKLAIARARQVIKNRKVKPN